MRILPTIEHSSISMSFMSSHVCNESLFLSRLDEQFWIGSSVDGSGSPPVDLITNLSCIIEFYNINTHLNGRKI